jgi:hypothetical protein
MNCEKSRELFADYLGEELARGDAQELQLHLKTCQGCRQELALLGSTKTTLIRALPEVSIPQHVAFNFSKPRPQGWFEWLRQSRYATVAAVTAGFVVCVASLSMFRTQVKIGQDGFEISFGSSAAQIAVPATIAPQVAVAGLGKEEVQRLVDAKLAEIDQAQTARFDRALMEVRNQWQVQRQQDWQQMSAGLRYLEANQKTMVQDAARNSTYIQSLANNFYARAEKPLSLQ